MTYNVTLLMQHLLLWKTNKYYIFREHVCRRRYATCNAHALYMVLPSMACMVLQNCSTLSHIGTTFFFNFTEYKIHVLIFSTTFVGHISHSKEK